MTKQQLNFKTLKTSIQIHTNLKKKKKDLLYSSWQVNQT